MSLKGKNDKMPTYENRGNSKPPVDSNTPIQMLGEIYSDSLPGQEVTFKMKQNKNQSMTLKSPETGDTIVANLSRNNVRYSYNPKKK